MSEERDPYKCENCGHEPHCSAECHHEGCDCKDCNCGHDRGEL